MLLLVVSVGRGGGCGCRLEGKGGKSASPHAGGRERPGPASNEVADVVVVLPALVVVDLDMSDAMDSKEPFREGCVGLRGGNAGRCWSEGLRAGKGGGVLYFAGAGTGPGAVEGRGTGRGGTALVEVDERLYIEPLLPAAWSSVLWLAVGVVVKVLGRGGAAGRMGIRVG